MKTVVVLLEKLFVCPVAVSVPDWWDDATAKRRLSTMTNLDDLDCMADDMLWEESIDTPAIQSVGAPGGYVEPVMSFGADDPIPAHPDQKGLPV